MTTTPPHDTPKPPPPVEPPKAEARKARRRAAAPAPEAVPKPKKGAFDDIQKAFALLGSLFRQDRLSEDNVPDEADAMRRYHRLMTMVWWQGIVIIALAALLIFSAPFLRPYYKYRTQSPSKEVGALVPLEKPNMTDRAILSWATTSITEIMTIGFGDFDKQILGQKQRFTSEGWESFLKAVRDQDLRAAFKSQQLVLTTVPSNTPVIVAQGVDPLSGDEYQWVVEMPIIMTYVTNNNVKRQSRSIIRLTIVRVPSKDSFRGVAIKSWQVAGA
jgi:hypothetical protein